MFEVLGRSGWNCSASGYVHVKAMGSGVSQYVYSMQEALRMYPPVAIGQLRVSYSHDIALGGQLIIPAGTVIWVPHHSIQNVSFNWDEPKKFLPGATAS